MKENGQKEIVSQSLFNTSAQGAEMAEQLRQRQELQRIRRRKLIIFSIPLLVLLLAVIAGYKMHERSHIEAAKEARAKAEAAPPPSMEIGYTGAKLKLQVTVPDESFMESKLGMLLYNAMSIKPSELCIKYILLAPKDGKYNKDDYGITVDGRKEFTFPNARGEKVTARLTLDVEPELLADAINYLHAETYGKVRVPLQVKAQAAPVHKQEKEKSPLDSLQIPVDSTGRN